MDTVIIDEISMISAEFFAGIEKQVREIRGRGKGGKGRGFLPFGGVQLIVCGVCSASSHAVSPRLSARISFKSRLL